MSLVPHAQNTTVSGGILSAPEPVAALQLPLFSVTSPRAASDSQRRSKAKQDPKVPRRAWSAYIFFSRDWRERIEAENPDAGFDEVGRLLGAKWKALDEEEKKPYIDQAARDKARAEEEKVAYDKGGKKSAASGDDEEEEE